MKVTKDELVLLEDMRMQELKISVGKEHYFFDNVFMVGSDSEEELGKLNEKQFKAIWKRFQKFNSIIGEISKFSSSNEHEAPFEAENFIDFKTKQYHDINNPSAYINTYNNFRVLRREYDRYVYASNKREYDRYVYASNKREYLIWYESRFKRQESFTFTEDEIINSSLLWDSYTTFEKYKYTKKVLEYFKDMRKYEFLEGCEMFSNDRVLSIEILKNRLEDDIKSKSKLVEVPNNLVHLVDKLKEK